jgi:hypothetical protein
MMYCPKCASENGDEVKFCRVCGTNLERVSLVLAGKPLPDTALESDPNALATWLTAQRAGVRQLVQGIILLAVSATIGLISYLALSGSGPKWFFLWMVFFGWLAGWGAVSLASGASQAIEAMMALRYLRSQPERPSEPLTLANVGEPIHLASVTEQTTRQLSAPSAAASSTTPPKAI